MKKVIYLTTLLFLMSCSSNESQDSKQRSFVKVPFQSTDTGPDLVLMSEDSTEVGPDTNTIYNFVHDCFGPYQYVAEDSTEMRNSGGKKVSIEAVYQTDEKDKNQNTNEEDI
ncbi:MAG: hypothetical protein JKY54_09765 [Flavobacteriales bacterium]|nr:hypothetical protein [Flavobacteriales bacterium]